MNGLSLCSGVGALELGIHLVEPKYKTVCYVEGEAYAVAVLAKRMEEGWLDKAPIWDDIRTFNGDPWCGVVDIITAGFPCQPWSVAGKRQYTNDERWLWNDIWRIISEIRPRFVFLENVPGLITGGGLSVILGCFAGGGYDARWTTLSAGAIGANHKRKRVWILAHDNHRGCSKEGVEGRLEGIRGREEDDTMEVKKLRSNVANATSARNLRQCKDNPLFGNRENEVSRRSKKEISHPKEQGLPEWYRMQSERLRFGKACWWFVEPPLGRVANGVAHRVDRIRACGNGVVPLVAAVAYSVLKNNIRRRSK